MKIKDLSDKKLLEKEKNLEKMLTTMSLQGKKNSQYLRATKLLQNIKKVLIKRKVTQKDGSFTQEEREVIDKWRVAKLTVEFMTKEQIELIKRYVKGNPRW